MSQVITLKMIIWESQNPGTRSVIMLKHSQHDRDKGDCHDGTKMDAIIVLESHAIQRERERERR